MRTYTDEELKIILDDHQKWRSGKEGGVRANLTGANLEGVNLTGANLEFVNLSWANLRKANLTKANLYRAHLENSDLHNTDLSSAYLYEVNLVKANLAGADLYEATLTDANLAGANLYKVNLYGANLYGATLEGANLEGANLYRVSGDLEHLKSILCEKYPVTYTAEVMQIGCEKHSFEDWWNFGDKAITKMGSKKALKWWGTWKPILQKIIEASPATPTGYVKDSKK